MALMPMIGRLRVLRSWGGIMDMSMDGSPIIDRTPIDGLYLNAGWCYGGFKATPASGWCFAHTIARDEPHALSAAYRLDRFATGHLIDEKGRRRPAQPALRPPCAFPAPTAAPATRTRVQSISATPRGPPGAPTSDAPPDAASAQPCTTTSTCATTPPGRTGSSGTTAPAAATGWS